MVSRNRVIAAAIFLSSLLLFFILRDTSPTIVNSPRSKPGIIAFGDSLTAGTGGGGNGSYPSQLEVMLGEEVMNLGIPGDTTESALARLSDVSMYDPGVVLITLGGNDLKNRVPIQIVFDNLKTIVQYLQNQGALVVVGGLDIPMYGRGFDEAYLELGESTGAVVIPNIFDGIFANPDYMSDPIHPNGRGYGIMAGYFYEALKPHLEP